MEAGAFQSLEKWENGVAANSLEIEAGTERWGDGAAAMDAAALSVVDDDDEFLLLCLEVELYPCLCSVLLEFWRRRKYFWAWLATCEGVLVTTQFLEMLLQSPLPYFFNPFRNNLSINYTGLQCINNIFKLFNTTP